MCLNPDLGGKSTSNKCQNLLKFSKVLVLTTLTTPLAYAARVCRP
jgi:hypothetical protein